jgi:hypothetical protein
MILSGALIALVMLVTTNVFMSSALAVPVGTGINPNSMIAVFTIKKAALICDSGASAPPAQQPPEIGGCVDVMNPDTGVSGSGPKALTDFRYNEYMFTGEQLAELVVARDLSGAQFLASTANLLVDGQSKVTCQAIGEDGSKALADGKWKWYGHDVSDLLDTLPPAMGVTDHTGFHEDTDMIYSCLLTVTPDMVGSPSSVAVQVSDVSSATATTDVQKWYFNPAISISISFDSGTSISFPAAQAGQTVYSTNTLMIKNTAAGGVDLAAYLTGNDLRDTSGIGLCPDSNVLDVTNLAYRCKVGTYMSEQFTPFQHLNSKDSCYDLSVRECMVDGTYCEKQCKDLTNCAYNDLLPDASSEFTSILYNGHTAECWFQLKVPFPCIGTFSAANAVDVLVRAI